ncbi:DNA primase [Candidatus Gracilibacteria bacterium]|nr:DNA primase [Candidatus Gracilibacteria bacterium]
MSSIDEVRDKIDIVDLISSSGVQLRKAGRSFLGFCPFHPNTRTPAFHVYPESQSFYCFGCHASGTAFDFVMRKQGVDFREALEQLALRAGVQLKERSEDDRQVDQQRTRLLECNAAAAHYFRQALLRAPQADAARAYVEKRGLNAETAEAFQLGYSLDDWSHLLSYLSDRRGFDPEEIEATGLAIRSENRGYYDRFRGRLMFPIRNARGEIVGFGGRALGDGQPKYLNTPETLLFKKGELLYGLDLARDTIRSEDRTVVVEGYVDVITAHQHGFRNVVAPLGTALTKAHIALLKRLSHNVYLALDADAAGQRATLRGLAVLRESVAQGDDDTRLVTTAQGAVRMESDVSLRIIRMPPGLDPDDVIRAEPERWRTLVAEAAPVMDFYIEMHTAGRDLKQPAEQRDALDKLLPLLGELDGTQQRVYIARVEQVIGIRAELILDLLKGGTRAGNAVNRSQAANARPTRLGPPRATATTVASGGGPSTREDHLLALAIRYPAVAPLVEQGLQQGLEAFPLVKDLLGFDLFRLFDRPDNQAVWRAWQQLAPELRPMGDNLLEWANSLDEALHERARYLIGLAPPRSEEYRYRQEAEKCARQIRIDQVRSWQRRLPQSIAAAENDEERQSGFVLLAELQGYYTALSTPRRSSTYSDLRDTLGKE